MSLVCLFAFAFLLIQLVNGQPCAIKKYEEGKNVCVCNSTYCDTVDPLAVGDLTSGSYQHYGSSKLNPGISSKVNVFKKELGIRLNYVRVDKSKKYQTIIGFGGAFSDSTGLNIKSLPEDAQKHLIDSYWSKNGIEYNLCRVPVGGTDFSSRGYSYDDDHEDDDTLEDFALQQDDFDFKIPYIQQAIKARDGGELKLFASAWSAPRWMKTNPVWSGRSLLQEKYYQTWANYYIKFFEAYKKEGIDFWGMTTQNEPFDGFVSAKSSQINAMGFGIYAMNRWLQENLGPTIKNSSFNHLKIIIHDDSRLTLPLISLMLNNEQTLPYIDGVGLHWYLNKFLPASFIDLAKTDKKDVFLLATEACTGFLHKYGEKSVDPGSWLRADQYLDDIFENMEHGVAGWVDWNMVLNTEGGPTYIKNYVDSPILANATAGEFYKQPMFYALGHFSKFVVPGSVRIHSLTSVVGKANGLKSVAFLRPDNLTAVLVHNTNDSEKELDLEILGERATTIKVEGNSINTILFK